MINLLRVTLLAAFTIAVVRFLLVLSAGVSYWDGDFFASMPGPHVRLLNPTLWASPDLSEAWGHNRYIYGPTQHLTVLPFMLLDSFQHIARVLLVLYAGLMLGSLYFMWRMFTYPQAHDWELLALLAIAMFLFPPAMQALLQREFEVVIFFVFNLAAYWLVKGREGRAGAAFGYITWFKYFPAMTLVYLAARRRFRAAVAYLVASALVLLAAHVLFGLENFTQTATRAEGFLRPVASGDFCAGWGPADQTSANLQWGLCGLSHRWRWLPAQGVFYGVLVLTAVFVLQSFVRFERVRVHRPDLTRSRTIWELSLLAIAMSFLIHNHYHYLILLLFPISALSSRYWIDGSLPKAWLLAASYVLLGAFITSPTLFTRALGVSGWDLFAENALYLYGGLILLALVLWEYRSLAPGLKLRGYMPDDRTELPHDAASR